MKSSAVGFLIFFLLNTFSATVSASPVLIDRLPFGTGSGTYLDIQQNYYSVSIALGYGNYNTTQFIFDFQIGEDKKTQPGQTGVYDFNAGNSADFSTIAERLSSGDTSFYLSANVYDQESNFVGWLGASQNDPWFSPNKLAGSSIDFIRLNIEQVMFGYHTSNPYDIYTKSSAFISGNFEFYGTPASVPLPSAIWLFVSGFVVLFAKISRKHGR